MGLKSPKSSLLRATGSIKKGATGGGLTYPTEDIGFVGGGSVDWVGGALIEDRGTHETCVL